VGSFGRGARLMETERKVIVETTFHCGPLWFPMMHLGNTFSSSIEDFTYLGSRGGGQSPHIHPFLSACFELSSMGSKTWEGGGRLLGGGPDLFGREKSW